MPVRTSSVVAVGLVGLTAIGVITIFGSSLLALTAPAEASRAPSPSVEKQPAAPPTTGAGTPDGGASPGTTTAAPTEKPSTKDGP